MGFGQALSGLNAAAQNLDVIGNNIANANTVGFKAASATFADVYATSRVGLGVQVADVVQRFTTGNVTVTGNQYDMAINGDNGFFRLVSQNGEILYSRNGQFHKDENHYIVNAQGHQLTGFPPDAIGAEPQLLRVPIENIEPSATQEITASTNLNSAANAIDSALHPFSANDPSTFTTAQPITIYDSLGNSHQLMQYFIKREGMAAGNDWEVRYTLDGHAVEVGTPAVPEQEEIPRINFDFSLLALDAEAPAEQVVEYEVAGRKGYAIVKPESGTPGNADYKPAVAYNLVLGAADTSTDPGTIAVRRGTPLSGVAEQNAIASSTTVSDGAMYKDVVPGVPAKVAVWGDSGTLSFDTNGRLASLPPVINIRVENPGGTSGSPAEDLLVAIDFTGSTQFKAPFRQNAIQDGYSSGEFTGVSVSADGTLWAAYTNGKTQAIGTLALANFNNVNGLRPVGQNAWSESPESGAATLGRPGANGLASVMGQAVEASNVDMSAELVNMIIAQRSYQANAQTVKTQDQIMQTLMSMR